MSDNSLAHPAWAGRLQWAVLGGPVLAVGLLLLGRVQIALYILSASLLAAAVVRWFLPAPAVRLLVSRHRVTDVIASTALGLALGAVAILLPQ